MAQPEDSLAQSERHVREAEKRVARQIEIIAEMEEAWIWCGGIRAWSAGRAASASSITVAPLKPRLSAPEAEAQRCPMWIQAKPVTGADLTH